MKVLHICPLFPPNPADFGGGVTQVVHNVGKQLVKRGHRVDVYTSGALGASAHFAKIANKRNSVDVVLVDGIRVHYFPYLVHYYTFFLTPTVVSAAKKSVKEYDIIHIHDFRSFQGIAVAHYARKFGVPYVVQAHGSLVRTKDETKRNLLKRILDSTFGYKVVKNASKVIALSRVEAKQYNDLRIPDEKIEIVPNGIDLSSYADLPPQGYFKKKFNIPPEEKLILYLGRINKSKGIDFLVKAYSNLSKNGKHDHAILVISGPDDGYLSELRQLINNLEIGNAVVFTGGLSKKEKVSAFVDSNIVVNVEPRNVFGLVPLEAAACSTPVIVCKGNAISETVDQGGFGFSVGYYEVNELAKIIHKMLTSEESSMEMGEKGRKFIFQNFDWAKIVTKLEKVYEKTCSASHPHMCQNE